MSPPLMKYKVRAGTVDFGKVYEWKLAAWVVLRCVLSEEDLWISSNADGVEAFDDVVFRLGDKTFMLQLKHKNEPTVLYGKDFLAPRKGDYSLLKYGEDIAKVNQTCGDPNVKKSELIDYLSAFNEIYFVLFANRKVRPCNFLERCDDKGLSFLDSSKDGSMFKIQTEELPDDLKKLNYHNFFLFANQIHAKHLDIRIRKEIDNIARQLNLKHFDGKRVAEDFIKFVELWAKGLLGGHYCLTKQDILTKLSELFFRQFELKLEHEKFSTSCSKQQDIWNRIIQDKAVTVIDFDKTIVKFILNSMGSKFNLICKEPKTNWAEDLTEDEKNCFFEDHPHLKTHMLKIVGNHCGRISLLDVYKSLWIGNQIPMLLIIRQVSQYIDILRIMAITNCSLKIIVLNKSGDDLFPPNSGETINHFQTIQDLSRDNAHEILSQMVLFQGRPSAILGNLADDSIFYLIKCKDIIRILQGNFNVGNKLNPLLPYFIHRNVSKILLKLEVLQTVQNEIFCIEESSEDYTQKLSMKYIRTQYFQDVDLNALKNCRIIIIREGFKVEELKNMKSLNTPIHYVVFHDQNHLEWKFSYGSNQNLSRFYVDLDSVTESDVRKKLCCPTNIVSASPGMGKSILMDYVAWKAPLDKWVLRIDLNGHQRYYESKACQNSSEASEHIDYFKNSLLSQSGCDNDLNKAIFKKFSSNKDVIILLDGLDEVSPYYKETVTKIAKSLHEEGYSLWLTTRPHLKSHLEKEFKTFSITLKAFTRENQKQFLTKYFRTSGEADLVNEYVEQLLEAAKENLNDDDAEFTGIPLQSKLLADVFEDDCKRYVSSCGADKFNTKFDLLYLYENFVKKKIDIQRKRFGDAIKDVYTMSREHHSRFALILLFRLTDDMLCDIKKGLEDYYVCKSDKIQVLQRFGLITVEQLDQNLSVKFVHRTFGEYLAAQWLSENFDGSRERSREIARLLMKQRFSRDYKFLFNLFDRLVCRNYPLLLSVINKDSSKALRIIESDPDKIVEVDACGRSVFHLSALYGVDFPQLFDLQQIILTQDSQQFLHRELYKADHILGILDKIPKNQVPKTESDSLGYNPLDYALANRSLHTAEILCKMYKMSYIKSNAIEMSCRDDYLAYCAILKYKNLIIVLLEYFAFEDTLTWKTNYPYKRMWKFYENLGYMSIISNYNHYFQTIFSGISKYNTYGSYRNYASDIKNYQILSVNKYDTLNWNNSPYYSLCHAIAFDCKSDIDRLMSDHSEVHRQDGYRLTPLHHAVLCRNVQTLNILLSEGAEVNHQDVIGNAPLHLAVSCNRAKPFSNVCLDNKDCQQTHYNITSKLLSHGYAVNIQNHAGDSPTHIALAAKNFDVAKLLISHNADINLANREGKNIIHFAVEHSSFDILKEILLPEADLNKRDHFGETPLFYAVKSENSDMAELLVSKGANINITNRHGKTALDVACNQRCFKLAHYLFNIEAHEQDNDVDKNALIVPREADVVNIFVDTLQDDEETSNRDLEDEVDVKDFEGNTRLFHAVRDNNREDVKVLISQGANVNLVNKKGQTVLHFAAKYNSQHILRDILNRVEDINKQDDYGWTPLFYAIDGNNSTRMLFFDKGANVSLSDKKGQTLLHLAAKNNFYDALKDLLEESSESIDEQDCDGWTALFYAVDNNNLRAARLLVSHGAKVNLSDKNGRNLLHLAARTGSSSILNEFIHTNRGHIDTQDCDGWSPLFYAVESKNQGAAKLLILNEANVKLINKKYETVLHLAAKHGSNYILNEILNKGAYIDRRTKCGWTALFYALFHNQLATVKLLIFNGSDVNVTDKNGKTAIDIAEESGFDDILQVLQEHAGNDDNENGTKCAIS